MTSAARLRPNPPSRARRNVRWAAFVLVALSLAPAGSPGPSSTEEDATLATEVEPAEIERAPWLADGGGLDSAIE